MTKSLGRQKGWPGQEYNPPTTRHHTPSPKSQKASKSSLPLPHEHLSPHDSHHTRGFWEWQSRTGLSKMERNEAMWQIWNGKMNRDIRIWLLSGWSNLNKRTCAQLDNIPAQTTATAVWERPTVNHIQYSNDVCRGLGGQERQRPEEESEKVTAEADVCVDFLRICSAWTQNTAHKHNTSSTLFYTLCV